MISGVCWFLLNVFGFLQILHGKFDELVKSLILFAPQAILGFMTRLAKLQELGLTPSDSLQFLKPDAS
jgi:hypothetical protein